MDERMQQEEQAHLEKIVAVLTERLKQWNLTAEESRRQAMEQKQTLWQDLYEMDRRDQVNAREEINASIAAHDKAMEEAAMVGRLLDSPYFGRIDFQETGDEPETFYIGLTGLQGKRASDILVYDWRAPVASMFYDFDVGPASYEAPMGKVSGDLLLRRQFKITGGKLDYVLDSAIKIDDDILQKELSRATSPRMRNIIATIQREQNRIIRTDDRTSVIVQGVAGSGKTSVALHKVAYLLYTYRGKITSRNLLILSPSKVFSDYISGILPELGEENVTELSFDQLAWNELGQEITYERRYDQLEYILNHSGQDDVRLREIELKSTRDYALWLKEYAEVLLQENFRPQVFVYGQERFEAEEIADLFYNRFAAQPFFVRIQWIQEKLLEELEIRQNKEMGSRAQKAVERALGRMVRCDSLPQLYSGFIHWLRDTGRADLREVDTTQPVAYEDLFPMVLLKYYMKGSRDFSRIRHLVVDEMQDYSPVQYEILNYLFHCPKTILGDISQNLNLHSGIRQLDEFSGDLANVEIIKLNKSFRSSWEIAQFANAISPVDDFDVVERHGEPPQVRSFAGQADLVAAIEEELRQYHDSEYQSIAILCKTAAHAEAVYNAIRDREETVHFITPDSDAFLQGITVTTAYLAKGLEFDVVVVADADADTYRTETDRQNLYVACTRALHRLRVFHTGTATPLLPADR
jgi:DNA helicase-2/ATP-dependent DNA helicase PcrA